MSVLKYKDASGNWIAADTLINGEFRYTVVEPLDVSTGIIGYDLSKWVGAGANFMLCFACDLNSSASSGDWDIHVIHCFDGVVSDLRDFNKTNAHSNLTLDSIFLADSTFDMDYNQETRILRLSSDKNGENIAGGARAFDAVLFYCG